MKATKKQQGPFKDRGARVEKRTVKGPRVHLQRMNEEKKRQELAGFLDPRVRLQRAATRTAKKDFFERKCFSILIPSGCFFFFSSSVQGLNHNSRIIFVSFFSSEERRREGRRINAQM